MGPEAAVETDPVPPAAEASVDAAGAPPPEAGAEFQGELVAQGGHAGRIRRQSEDGPPPGGEGGAPEAAPEEDRSKWEPFRGIREFFSRDKEPGAFDDAQIVYETGTEFPDAEGLDNGRYAIAGVPDENGNIRNYFPLPNPTDNRRIEGIPGVEYGTEVRKGDAIYRAVDPELDTRIEGAKGDRDRAFGSLSAEINGSRDDASSLRSDLSLLDGQIAREGSRLGTLEAELARFETGFEQGAISRVRLDDTRSEVIDSQNRISDLEIRRNEVERQIGTATTLDGRSANDVIDIVRNRGAGFDTLPQSIVNGAQDFINAETSIASLNAEKEALTIRSPVDGIVSQPVLAGIPTYSFNGEVDAKLVPPDRSATTSATDLERQNQIRNDLNRGVTPAVVPKFDAEADLVVADLSLPEAEEFQALKDTNQRARFVTADGRTGSAEVKAVFPGVENDRSKVFFTNERFDDGSSVTAAERQAIRVFAESDPTALREGDSSSSVTFGEVSNVTAPINAFPVAEQDVTVEIPVYRKGWFGREVQIGTLRSEFRIQSDNRSADIIKTVDGGAGITSTFIPKEGEDTSTNGEVSTRVLETNEGSNVGGYPIPKSGTDIQVNLPFIAENTSQTGSVGGGGSVSGKVKGTGADGNVSVSKGGTNNADGAQVQFNIDVVPSGSIRGDEIGQVVAPRKIVLD